MHILGKLLSPRLKILYTKRLSKSTRLSISKLLELYQINALVQLSNFEKKNLDQCFSKFDNRIGTFN